MTIIYVTKYALTTGVFTSDASVSTDGKSAKFKDANGFNWYLYGNDFQLTKSEALERAEEMRTRKLQSLNKQVKKISLMEFEVKE